MTYAELSRTFQGQHLDIFGAFHPEPDDETPADTGTLVLLGPHEPGFWATLQSTPGFTDQAPNPLDRWSVRTVSALARETGATALFPFGGPPFQPFIAWAHRSGRAWASPVGMLVHDRAGLMLSYRGALALPDRIELPAPGPRPCDTCAEKPCLTACPVLALGPHGYDLAACHGHLGTDAGADCMGQGCAARRACPVSRDFGRDPAQSAFHMKAFHP